MKLAIGMATLAFGTVALMAVTGCGSDDGGGTTGGGTTTTTGAAYSASCESYYGSGGCCEKLLKATGAPSDTCSKAKKILDDGIKQGGKPADYETACKSALDAASQAGYCK